MNPFDRIGEKVSKNTRSKIGEELDGLSKIGWGFSRTVYRIETEKYGEKYKGKVIKFGSTGKDARTANQREMETWMALGNNRELREHFCPIRDKEKDFRWIIMDYARPVKSFISRIKSKKKQKLIKRRLDGIEENLDLKHENLGYHSERGLVFIDYPWGGDFIIRGKNEVSLANFFRSLNDII